MSHAPIRHNPSAGLRFATRGIRIHVEESLGIGKLRIVGDDRSAAFQQCFGVQPPAVRTGIARDDIAIAWLAPDEWLLIGSEARIAAEVDRLSMLMADRALAVDIGHGRVSLILEGPSAREAISSVSALDIRPGSFAVGSVARTALASTGMFIARLLDAPDGGRFRIVVDQTMARHAVRMLAGPDYLQDQDR